MRLTSTEIWQKDWFQALTPAHKCLWQYVCSNCDACGVWDTNWRMASFCIGETFTPESLAVFGHRIEILPSGKVWIVGFCDFQYGTLSRECRGQIYVFKALEKHGLLNRVAKSTGSLSDRLSNRHKDKDKEENSDRKREQKKTVVDPAQTKPDEIGFLAVRIGAIMHRRPDSKWTDDEKLALENLMPIPEENIAAVERYYAAHWPPDRDRNMLRHSLATLLANWPGEVDRALHRFGTNGSELKPQRKRSTD